MQFGRDAGALARDQSPEPVVEVAVNGPMPETLQVCG